MLVSAIFGGYFVLDGMNYFITNDSGDLLSLIAGLVMIGVAIYVWFKFGKEKA